MKVLECYICGVSCIKTDEADGFCICASCRHHIRDTHGKLPGVAGAIRDGLQAVANAIAKKDEIRELQQTIDELRYEIIMMEDAKGSSNED